MKIRTVVLVMLVVLAQASQTQAHHSLIAYDQNRVVTLQGTVSMIEWTNPHAAINLAVSSPGVTTTMRVDMAAPRALQQRGFDKSFLKVGDMVTIDAWMMKTPT